MQTQTQHLLPTDRILCTIVGDNKEGGAIAREFVFTGVGEQLGRDGNPDHQLPMLLLPPTAYAPRVAAERVAFPAFPTADYVALIKAKDYEAAGELQGAFHADLEAYGAQQGTGGAVSLSAAIIDAFFAFLGQHTDIGIEQGATWQVSKKTTVCRIPPRATPQSSIVIVLQPTPTWG